MYSKKHSNAENFSLTVMFLRGQQMIHTTPPPLALKHSSHRNNKDCF
jgi:hypothetical protein